MRSQKMLLAQTTKLYAESQTEKDDKALECLLEHLTKYELNQNQLETIANHLLFVTLSVKGGNYIG